MAAERRWSRLYAIVLVELALTVAVLAWFGTLFWLYGCACASFAASSISSCVAPVNFSIAAS